MNYKNNCKAYLLPNTSYSITALLSIVQPSAAMDWTQTPLTNEYGSQVHISLLRTLLLLFVLRHSAKTSIPQEELGIDDKVPPAARDRSEVARA